jgi:hypothetical protein
MLPVPSGLMVELSPTSGVGVTIRKPLSTVMVPTDQGADTLTEVTLAEAVYLPQTRIEHTFKLPQVRITTLL